MLSYYLSAPPVVLITARDVHGRDFEGMLIPNVITSHSSSLTPRRARPPHWNIPRRRLRGVLFRNLRRTQTNPPRSLPCRSRWRRRSILHR